MGLKSSVAFVLLLLALQQLKFCKGEGKMTEVYEIDYKGPETHAVLPPPGHSRAALLTGNKNEKPKARNAIASDKQTGGG